MERWDHLPEGAEIALLGLAIPEGILTSVIESIGGVTVKFGPAHPKALGGFNCTDTAFT